MMLAAATSLLCKRIYPRTMSHADLVKRPPRPFPVVQAPMGSPCRSTRPIFDWLQRVPMISFVEPLHMAVPRWEFPEHHSSLPSNIQKSFDYVGTRPPPNWSNFHHHIILLHNTRSVVETVFRPFYSCQESSKPAQAHPLSRPK